MKKRALNSRGPLVLVLCFAAGSSAALQAASGTWKQTAAGTAYSWNDPANWLSGTGFPSLVDDVANVNIDITGAQTISLNAPITVGTLNLGDAATAFSGQTINAGTGGSLTFDVSSGEALLARTVTVNPNLNDVFNTGVTLADNLEVRFPWLNSGNGMQMNGAVGGTGGIRLTAANYPDNGVGQPQFLDLTNPGNSFTGGIELANGALVYRGDVLVSTNGALGNAATPVLIGSAATVVGDGTPGLQNGTTLELRLQALDDTSNYTFARDLDFSGASGTTAQTGRMRFGITGNNAGAPNTNTLTVSGNITLPANDGRLELLAVRQGQTLRFTGEINPGPNSSGTLFWGPLGPGLSTTDGRNAGAYRFSDLARTYSNAQNLTGGTVIVEGSVGPAGSSSPIGTNTFTLGDGNGGNVFNANTEGANRRLFLELGSSTFERILSPGPGSGANLGTAANISGVLPAVFQPRYGNSGNVNLLNGYEFGGLNTSDTVIFTQSISPGNVTVAATGTAGGLGGTNPVTVVHNIALSAVTGGTVEFRGGISGNAAPVLGDTATPGAAVNANQTRITINQFRNHPNVDVNVDGVPDANANKTTGTATGGTVVLAGNNSYGGSTEILGGTLRLDYSFSSSSKLSDTAPLILSGGTLEISGDFHSEDVESTVLTANTGNTITSRDGAEPIHLNQITAGPGAALNFTAENVATTDTLNTNGILGPWATINATDFATNSTGSDNGLVTAYTAYTNVTRKSSGTKIIASLPASNVRLVEGTGAAGDLTLAAPLTTVNTLNQSSSGGASAAVIDPLDRTLAVNTILIGSGTGGLSIVRGLMKSPVSGGSILIRNSSANPFSIGALIEDNTTPSGLTLIGPGRTILTAPSDYSGHTAIFESTLQLGTGIAGGDGSILSPSITNHGALVYNLSADHLYAGVISGTGTLTKDGAGALTLTGANTGTGSVTVAAGTLQLGDGNTTGSLAAGPLLTNNGIFAVNRSNALTQGLDFPRSIAGSGALTKNGAGTLTLSAANPYTGVTTVTAGIVAVSHPGALGTVDGETVINSNGTTTTGGRVSLSNNITTAENFTVTGTGDGPNYQGAISAGSGTNTLTGTITLTGTSSYRLSSIGAGTVMHYGLIQRSSAGGGALVLDPTAGAFLYVDQPIENSGGTLTCHAGGTVILNAPANNLGNTVVQNSTTLRLGAAEALPSNRNLQIGNGLGNTNTGAGNDVGTFDLAGLSQTVNALNGRANGGAEPNNATTAARRVITSTQPGVSLLTVGNAGGSGTFDGVIQNGSAIVSLTKTGTGTQILTGPTTYTGDTSINAGTLALGAAAGLADASTVRLDNPGSYLQLADGVTDTVAALYIDGVAKTGTWGSSLSTAANIDDLHFIGTGILSVSATNPYTDWAVASGLQNPWLGVNPRLNGEPAADPDGDGMTNRQEYAFGLIPTSGASASGIVTVPSKTTGLWSYTRRQPALTGLTYLYQWSTTLSGPWNSFSPDAATSNNAAPVEIITVDIPNALLTHPRLFVRALAQ